MDSWDRQPTMSGTQHKMRSEGAIARNFLRASICTISSGHSNIKKLDVGNSGIVQFYFFTKFGKIFITFIQSISIERKMKIFHLKLFFFQFLIFIIFFGQTACASESISSGIQTRKIGQTRASGIQWKCNFILAVRVRFN